MIFTFNPKDVALEIMKVLAEHKTPYDCIEQVFASVRHDIGMFSVPSLDDDRKSKRERKHDALEKRVDALETELKKYKETEWDRHIIQEYMSLKPDSIPALRPDVDPKSLTEEEREEIFRREYYRRVAAFEAARDKDASTAAWSLMLLL